MPAWATIVRASIKQWAHDRLEELLGVGCLVLDSGEGLNSILLFFQLFLLTFKLLDLFPALTLLRLD